MTPVFLKWASVSGSTTNSQVSSPPFLMKATTSACLIPSMFVPLTWNTHPDVTNASWGKGWTVISAVVDYRRTTVLHSWLALQRMRWHLFTEVIFLGQDKAANRHTPTGLTGTWKLQIYSSSKNRNSKPLQILVNDDISLKGDGPGCRMYCQQTHPVSKLGISKRSTSASS